MQRLWNRALAHGLKEFAEIHKEPFAKFVDFTHLQLSKTLREFDDRITRFTANFEVSRPDNITTISFSLVSEIPVNTRWQATVQAGRKSRCTGCRSALRI